MQSTLIPMITPASSLSSYEAYSASHPKSGSSARWKDCMKLSSASPWLCPASNLPREDSPDSHRPRASRTYDLPSVCLGLLQMLLLLPGRRGITGLSRVIATSFGNAHMDGVWSLGCRTLLTLVGMASTLLDLRHLLPRSSCARSGIAWRMPL
ncbi:hypothetical protein F4780DRAFT_735024 [Xylariomycetidae sp. FL0641]|nr:hypothetical protein F4780DRAFT_735024 [Xylariomycetidae sp. FL0641]